jgi:plastocyanin
VRPASRLVVFALAAAAGTCGGSGGSSPSPVENPNQMIISAAGVLTPSELVVSPGSRVLFINNHTRSHYMASDPHPDHMDCPELDPVGVLAPGQRRETGNLNRIRTCGIHDHDDFQNQALWGRIVIR